MTKLTIAYRWQILAPAEQRRYADEGGEEPDSGDHGDHVFGRALDGVLERASDDEITVDADRAQVQYGRRTQQHIERRVRVTESAIQRPRTFHLQRQP